MVTTHAKKFCTNKVAKNMEKKSNSKTGKGNTTDTNLT